MNLPHIADHYKASSEMVTNTLQPKSAKYKLNASDVPCFIQAGGFKDRTTWLGHIGEMPYVIYLHYRDDITQGDQFQQKIGSTTHKYAVIVPPEDMLGRKLYLKCVCKKVKT
ncbi:MAG: hypothetical protein PHI12_10440 [Dehalococcoidales bacterium]|nr:hypothetical protein [Dehalococcoidales bacterium]